MWADEDFWRECCLPADDLSIELPFSRRFVPAEQGRLKRVLLPASQDDRKRVGIPRPEGLDLHRGVFGKHIFRVLLRNDGEDWIAVRLLVTANAAFERYHRADWSLPFVERILSRWIASPET